MKSINNLPLCVSLPLEMIQTIDRLRGDVSRSRFVLRLLEKGLKK